MGRNLGPVGAAEYHARWALREYRPCTDCSPRYRTTFAELRTLVQAADMLFDRAYEVYGKLTELSQEEHQDKPSDKEVVIS